MAIGRQECCSICNQEWKDNDLWEEIEEGVHKRCDKKLKKLSKLFKEVKPNSSQG